MSWIKYILEKLFDPWAESQRQRRLADEERKLEENNHPPARCREMKYAGNCKHCGISVECWKDEMDGSYVIPGYGPNLVTWSPNLVTWSPYSRQVFYVNCPNECGIYMIEHIDMQPKEWEVRLTEMEQLAALVDYADKLDGEK